MAIIYGRPDSERQLLDKYPSYVKTIEDIPRIHQEVKDKLKTTNGGLWGGIRRWYYQRQANKFEQNKDDFLHAGAYGELEALKRLSQLSDDYHILCGVKIELGNWVPYTGKKNLKSAQMDFVVVSNKGVVVIEVKNWSKRFTSKRYTISPHEQVDRARKVLWIALEYWHKIEKPNVTGVVLPVQGNIGYEPKHQYICVTDLNTIGAFLENPREEFSNKEVKRIVGRIKSYVTH